MPKTGGDIAVAIRALAKEHGVTVKRTLEDCRINRNFLYDLEKGNSSPSIDKLTRIAEYFGVSTAKLVGSENTDVERILEIYEKLSKEMRADLLRYMESLIE